MEYGDHPCHDIMPDHSPHTNFVLLIVFVPYIETTSINCPNQVSISLFCISGFVIHKQCHMRRMATKALTLYVVLVKVVVTGS